MGPRRKDFDAWARRATAGLDESGLMVGLIDGDIDSNYDFQLQIGHCLCTEKPLLLLVPTGTVIPDKLRLMASAVEEFDPSSEDSMQHATTRALKRIGIHRRH